jgi:hypothetical protein
MLIIGCDFHTRYQQMAMMDSATGELVEWRSDYENGEANTFYRSRDSKARAGNDFEQENPRKAEAW